MDFPRDFLAASLAKLASEGIYLGTSSWKYQGWLGLLYTPELYTTRGKLSKAKFEKTCFAEYGKVFKTVCLDAGFYQFPTAKMIEGYLSQVPADFKMSIKVTEDITVRRFSTLPRYGKRAGQFNERFLDAELFTSSFLDPLTPYRDKIGTLILEFSHFHVGDWKRGRDFVEALDAFLDQLPKDWTYSVEVRNRSLLQPEYFEVLRRHGIAHTFNSWSRMPSVLEQMQLPGSLTANFATARFLLKPGRSYEEAVEAFAPYNAAKDPNEEIRAALIKLLLAPAPVGEPVRRFLYVNNRLEGCALWTIYAVLSGLLPASKRPSAISEMPAESSRKTE